MKFLVPIISVLENRYEVQWPTVESRVRSVQFRELVEDRFLPVSPLALCASVTTRSKTRQKSSTENHSENETDGDGDYDFQEEQNRLRNKKKGQKKAASKITTRQLKPEEF